MKKLTVKLITLLLVACVLIPTFASCDSENDNGKGTETSENVSDSSTESSDTNHDHTSDETESGGNTETEGSGDDNSGTAEDTNSGINETEPPDDTEQPTDTEKPGEGDTPENPPAHTCVFDKKVTTDNYKKFEATCTSKAVYYFSCACGAVGTATFEYGEKLAHIFNCQIATDEHLKIAETLTEGAVYYYSCKCGENGTNTFTVHTSHVHNYNQTSTAEKYLVSKATCTAKAKYNYSCICGAIGTATFEHGEALDHNFEWVVDTPASKTQTGLKHEDCTRCDAVRNEGTVIPMLTCKHATAAKTNQVDADHHNTGKQAYWHCTECNKYFSDEACLLEITDINTYGIIAKIDHDFGTSWKKDANQHWHECACGDKTDVAAHTYNQEVVDDLYKKSDATSTQAAQYFYSCSCGAKGATTFTYGDSVPLADYTFVAHGDGYALKSYSGTLETITVPSTYNGKSVIAIGTLPTYTSLDTLYISGDGFYENSTVKKVILPESIKVINVGAFAYSSVEEIVFPSSCRAIYSYAFYECDNLTKVTFNGGTVTSDILEQFTNVTELVLGADTTYENGIFSVMPKLQKLTVPKLNTSAIELMRGELITSKQYYDYTTSWNPYASTPDMMATSAHRCSCSGAVISIPDSYCDWIYPRSTLVYGDQTYTYSGKVGVVKSWKMWIHACGDIYYAPNEIVFEFYIGTSAYEFNLPADFTTLTISEEKIDYTDDRLDDCSFDIELQNKYVASISGIIGDSTAYIDEFSYGDYQMHIRMNDGTSQTLPLLAEYLSTADQALLGTVGAHTVTVNYEDLQTTLTITIQNHTFTGITFEDVTFYCSGNAYSIYVSGLPEGASVDYEGNGQSAEGVYTVTATITKLYYETKILTATMTVKLNEFTGITFENQTVMCSDNCSIYVLGAPEGATVVYDGNGQTEEGTYTVTATITKQYYKPLILSATMKVELNQFTGITFDDTTFIYSGQANSIYVTGTLPKDTNIEYTNNDKTEIGRYTVTVTITKQYYKTLICTATMEIRLAKINYVLGNKYVTHSNPITHNYGTSIVLQNAVLSQGNFDGWYTDADYTNRVYEISASNLSDITLYAKFNIIFNYEGSQILGLTEYGKSLSSITIPKVIDDTLITSIDSGAFQYCDNMEIIEISNSITTIGGSAFSRCSKLKTVNFEEGIELKTISTCLFQYCENLENINIPQSITEIGLSAFGYCISIKNITIPNGVQNIKDRAFSGCHSLQSIVFEENSQLKSIEDQAFYGCTDLTSISIPSTTTSIGYRAFSDCDSLTSIRISEKVNNIGSSVVARCQNLTSIIVDENNMRYHSSGNCLIETATGVLIAGCNASVIPSDGSVTIIGAAAFENCEKFTGQIPTCIVSIEEYAFCGCSSLPTIPVMDNLQNIGRYAFSWCTSLSGNISIPVGITSIGDYTFCNCPNISSITLPMGLLSIGDSAFANCSSLTSIDIPSSVKSIGYGTFDGCTGLIQKDNGVSYVDKWIIDCDEDVTSVIIRQDTIGLGGDAFRGCTNIKEIILPSSVTHISDGAFRECSNLGSINIHNMITSIGKYAFWGCYNLLEITIPSNVENIGYYAFYDCPNLTIYVEAETKPSGWAYSWNYSNCTVYWGVASE